MRVTGIGGVFFKAKDPDALRAWYRKHLEIDVQDWGGAALPWQDKDGMTVWTIFPDTTKYFAPSASPFMVNYRVADLDAVLAVLREEGCNVDQKSETSEFGKFGWVMDPEGNRIELWEPPRS
jgi:predicted enzyme related to lactoylglutathione lyase